MKAGGTNSDCAIRLQDNLKTDIWTTSDLNQRDQISVQILQINISQSTHQDEITGKEERR